MSNELIFFMIGTLWVTAVFATLAALSRISEHNRLIEQANLEAEYWERREAWYDNKQEKHDNNH